MIKSVTVKNYLDETLEIVLTDDNPKHGLILIGMDGIGGDDANINTTTLATSDGSMFNSASANERNIVLHFRFSMAPSIETSRQRTYQYFPKKKPLTLTIETDNRVSEIIGYVESNEPDIFSKEEGCTISIICPYPYFYSGKNGGVDEVVFYGVEPLFEFPFENESLDEPLLEFGSIENETEKTIYYNGDTEIGITIIMHAVGDVGNITIYNTGTREVMRIDMDRLKELTGSAMKAGDDIILDTNRGVKTVQLLRNGYYTNILNCLDRGSDWFTLAKGDNIFAYEAETGSENLEFKIQHRTLYEGV